MGLSLEEQIVEWSASRPAWQRAVLRRVALGDAFSAQDYDELVETLLTHGEFGNPDFGLEQLPQVVVGDPPVRLVSIAELEHVNALASDRALSFELTGITIIYGDNGSGKSGYARLLNRIARSRHREEVLSDVFRDSTLAKPTAALTVMIGDDSKSIHWPEATSPELQRMLFYDKACGEAYISSESDFPYRPSALFVMDGLIEACLAIRSRIHAKLECNSGAVRTLPKVDEDVKDSETGRYLAELSGRSSLDTLDALIQKNSSSMLTIGELKDHEARLRIADTTREKQRLTRRTVKLGSVSTHLEAIHRAIGDEAAAALEQERDHLKIMEQAANLLAKSFAGDPLGGVGTSPWKALWESARRFSEAHAYPDKVFPITGVDSMCVLCQQVLEEEGRERLSRFEAFVQHDTQTRARDARATWELRVQNVANLGTVTEAIETNLTDLETDYPELVRESRTLLAEYEVARKNLVDALHHATELPRSSLVPADTISRFELFAAAAKNEADSLSDPERTRERLAAVSARRRELELLLELNDQRQPIADEIARREERESLEAVENAVATGPITRKILEFSEESITEVVRDAFTRETDRLHLERVTMAKTRGERGALLHQPKFVGARQSVTLPRVLSEGERTALGLAAVFTEAHLDASESALILDDPVSSLDHIRREIVAARLASLAETRQIVVFTHDVSFVADLKREAKGVGVLVAERSVSKGRGGERKPGACSETHPWKAKDVPERMHELRRELARIRRDIAGWDEATYENEVATFSGNLSETWERIFSQEIVGQVLAEGGLEVRPSMVKVLARFSATDEAEFQASYARVSQWAKRHDKSAMVNYVAPDISTLEKELSRVDDWFRRVKGYKN